MLIEVTKQCRGPRGCGRVLPVSRFPDNGHFLRSICKDCHTRETTAWRRLNAAASGKPKRIKFSSAAVAKKARTMLINVRVTGPTDINLAWIANKIDGGACEITGLPFVFGARNHPMAPSIDRIDRSLPHTQDNCQVVLWCLNAFKGSADVQTFREALLKVAHAVVNKG